MGLSIEFWIGLAMVIFMVVLALVIAPLKLGMKSFVINLWTLKPLSNSEYKPPQTLSQD